MNNEIHNLFFIKDEQFQNSRVILTGPEFHHIRNVMRKKPGEIVCFTDGKGGRFKTLIEQVLQNAMVLKVVERIQIPRPNGIDLDLAIVPLKSGRSDFIIEKGTELGVNKFIFFFSQFSVIKTLNQPRIEHFKKIALSAMLQSKQYYLPEVLFVDDIFKEFSNYDLVAVGDKDGKDRISPGVRKVLLIIGPEGGFSPEEMDLFTKNKVRLINFGPNRLRSETAALAGIAIIFSYYNQ